MGKKVFKIFMDAIDAQERWLNRMSAQGWRLIKVQSFSYTFENCEPSRFIYKIQFVVEKSKKELEDYKFLLKQSQIRFFNKGINVGKFSFGSRRWRPYGKRGGNIASFPGTMNSELLIMEQENTGDEFHIFSDRDSKYRYYSTVQSIYILACVVLTLTFLSSPPTPYHLFQNWNQYGGDYYRLAFKIINFVVMVIFYIILFRISKIKAGLKGNI